MKPVDTTIPMYVSTRQLPLTRCCKKKLQLDYISTIPYVKANKYYIDNKSEQTLKQTKTKCLEEEKDWEKVVVVHTRWCSTCTTTALSAFVSIWLSGGQMSTTSVSSTGTVTLRARRLLLGRKYPCT